MKWNIGNKIGGLIVFTILALALLGGASYIMINQFISSVDWNNHTREVLQVNEMVISDLKDAETGQRGFLITGKENYLEPYNKAVNSIYDKLNRLGNLTKDNPVQQQRLANYRLLIDKKLEVLQLTINLRKDKGFEAAQVVVLTDAGKDFMDDFRLVFDAFEKEENELLSMRELKMISDSITTQQVIILGSLFVIVLIIIVGFLLIRNISKPLIEVTHVASIISQGDLRVKLKPSNRQDEIGLLTNAFNDMVVKLRGSIEEIMEGINMLGSSSSEILAATIQVASGTAETSTAINQTSSTVEEVRQASQLSSQKASIAAENAQETSSVAQTGNQAVEQTVEVMQLIRKQMEVIMENIVRLSEQSQQIGGIIASVNDVADQSNLLAVNASIEAAKAGEHGKGFSVVAMEIKSLAKLSKQATIQVRTILSDVQKATESAVKAAEKGNTAVTDGVNQSTFAGESIQSLEESVNEFVRTAAQIVASSQQQVIGMDQVSLAMNNINQAGAENAASMKQAENAAKELKNLGVKLKSLVDQYKL
jgi:methyl-accepting chemotaxis protein